MRKITSERIEKKKLLIWSKKWEMLDGRCRMDRKKR